MINVENKGRATIAVCPETIAAAPRLRSPAPAINLRWMLKRDSAAVLRIERDGFEFPWSETDFARVLRRETCTGIVAEADGEVRGFVIDEIKNRGGIVLLNLAVAPAWRRRGVATALVEEVKANFVRLFAGRVRIESEVGERNVAAQMFFRAMGFRAKKIYSKPWPQTPDDAYLFVYKQGIRDLCRRCLKQKIVNHRTPSP